MHAKVKPLRLGGTGSEWKKHSYRWRYTRIRRAHIHESSNNSCALQQKRTMYVVTTKKISSSCSSSLTHVENGGKNSRMKNSGPHKKYSEIITHLLKSYRIPCKRKFFFGLTCRRTITHKTLRSIMYDNQVYIHSVSTHFER